MGAVLIGNIGILQESNSFPYRLPDMEIIKITDEDNITLGETRKVRPLGQFTAVDAALIKTNPLGQAIPSICLDIYIKNSIRIIFQVYV